MSDPQAFKGEWPSPEECLDELFHHQRSADDAVRRREQQLVNIGVRRGQKLDTAAHAILDGVATLIGELYRRLIERQIGG